MRTFRAVWGCDFEFHFPDGAGGLPVPICATFREFNTGQEIRLWQDELRGPCPVHFTRDVLFVAYLASAEFSCFLQLGWPLPVAVFDCYVEFRRITNGRPTVSGHNGLSDALIEFGLRPIFDKAAMRDLALRGGPYSADERAALQDYNAEDVRALAELFPHLLADTNIDHALHRGRYMRAVAHVERVGVPIDLETLGTLYERWEDVQLRVITEMDQFGLWDGIHFREERLEGVVDRLGIMWPRHPSGQLMRDRDTFEAMAKVLPEWRTVHELRDVCAKLMAKKLQVGRDGRNRALLSPFKSITARNQPSNSKFIFGGATWVRSLIKPAEGWGIAYLDWSQQEFALAAALSGDEAMRFAYQSGDPYMAFAQRAGAAPAGATKKTHKAVRDQYKQAILATQYGQSFYSLAERIGRSRYAARDLLSLHRLAFPTFWQWNAEFINQALLTGRAETVHGWQLFCGTHDLHLARSGTGKHEQNLRSLGNWPMQTHGSEMMRLAMCVLIENGVRVVAPVHDAFLIEAPLAELDDVIEYAQRVMRAASKAITGGLEIDVDAEVVRYPERYSDERGAAMWARVYRLAGLEKSADTRTLCPPTRTLCPPTRTICLPTRTLCPPGYVI